MEEDVSGLAFDLTSRASDISLYRCRTRPVMLLRSTLSDHDARQLFAHEVEVAARLRGAEGCVDALACAVWQGTPVLLLVDRGEEVLTIPRTPMPSKRFLDLAITIAKSVVELHGRGIVHGDIRPGRIMIRDDRAVLFGFGRSGGYGLTPPAFFSTRIEPERLPYQFPAEMRELSYFDRRNDLYSLGVTLYQLLSGRLPFDANTPLSWSHAHRARAPYPIGRWHPAVPASIAAIIMKLLSKAPEDRYQTAVGLVADLQKCLGQLGNSMDMPFVLGSSDAREDFVQSQRLYGREAELQKLRDRLSQVIETQLSEIILIAGYSGIGKTTLVEAFRRELAGREIEFAAGKSDLVARSIPFSTLTEALGGLFRRILSSSETDIDRWRNTLYDALGEQGQLVAELIPEIAVLLPDLPAVPVLPATESQVRFLQTMMRLLESLGTQQRPLVLFLDDLQWADPATLDLLQRLKRNNGLRNVLLIGAYRENEVEPETALPDLIASTQGISLGPIGVDDAADFVGDSLGVNTAVVRELASAIVDKTAGNPLFISQFLRAAVDDGTIHFDRQNGRWSWSLTEIVQGGTDDIVALIAVRLGRLSDVTRHALSLFASLGRQASETMLCRILDVDSGMLSKRLEQARIAGLVYRLDDGYSFLHDRVQEAAYALISAEDAPAVHLQLARDLLASEACEALSENIFTIVSQYNSGRTLIEEADEMRLVADLNFASAGKAEAAAAYASAFDFYSIALELRRADPQFAIRCEIQMANCEFLNGNPVAATERLSQLVEIAAELEQRAEIACLLITIKTAMDDFAGAVDICLEYLSEQGVNWSASPGYDDVRAEFSYLEPEIANCEIRGRLAMPNVVDLKFEALLDVLGATLPPAFFSNKNLVCLVLCRMANVSKAHGNGAASALGYAYLGMVLGPMFGDYRAGYEFGKLGLELVQREGFERFRGRVSMTFAYHVLPYSEPIRAGRDLLAKALQLSQEGGDLTYVGFSSCTMVSSMLAAGEQLSAVGRRAEEALVLMHEIDFGLVADIVTSQLQAVRCLQGLSVSSKTFSDGLFDEIAFEMRLAGSLPLALANCWHHIRKLAVRVHFGDYDDALQSAAIARPLLWSAEGHLELVEYHFHVAIAKSRTGADLQDIKEHTDFLQVLANSCADNFSAMNLTVQAAVASRQGDQLQAFILYDQAIAAAQKFELPQIEGLACELAGKEYHKAGVGIAATSYLERSRNCYKAWGATAKVSQLESRYPNIRPSRIVPEALAFLSADVETVVRSSAAVAGEAVPSKMLRSFMTIALEHAGAQAGLLLLLRDGEYHIEAEALAKPEGIEVTFLKERVKRSTSLEFIARNCAMTLEPVIDNRRTNGSAVAIPLIARGNAIGILYLENSLSRNAYSPARTALLKLISAQAAISLENASLDEKESLLKEVHHRVKNNLQLISSLLSLQSAKVSDPAVAELFVESRNRVRSMALVHENLYRAGDFANVDMALHLKNLGAHLARAYASPERHISIEVQSEHINLNLDQAISCGLIINELVSNAFKHAFADTSTSGAIWIRFVRTERETVKLSVADNGVGLEKAEVGITSMGMQLVRDLTDQLNGYLEVEGEFGTQVSISFNAIEARE